MFPIGQMPIQYGGMTALATYYNCHIGFVVAADGFQRWEDPSTRSDKIRAMEKTDVQKIFRFCRKGIELGCTFCGDIASKNRTFDLQEIVADELGHIDTGGMRYCREMLEVAAERVQRCLIEAKEFPRAYVSFFGYFLGVASWIDINFHPPIGFFRLYDLDEKLPDGKIPPHSDGVCVPSTPDTIEKLIREKSDTKYSQLWSPPDRMETLDAAVDYVRGYIATCIAAETSEVELERRTVGGHVHVAMISPTSGFGWHTPPRTTPRDL